MNSIRCNNFPPFLQSQVKQKCIGASGLATFRAEKEFEYAPGLPDLLPWQREPSSPPGISQNSENLLKHIKM